MFWGSGLNMMELKNKYLIATPQVIDPIFQQSVIYICDHTEQGSMGFIINKPSEMSVAEVCSKLNFMVANARFFNKNLCLTGGPAHRERGFILHRKTKKNFNSSLPVNEALMLTTSCDVLDCIGTEHEPEDYLIALGCAMWGAEQLENEIRQNDWLIADASLDLLFKVPFAKRWQTALLALGVMPNKLMLQAGEC